MCLDDSLTLGLYSTFKVDKYNTLCSYMTCSTELVDHVYWGVCHALLEVYNSSTGSESTNRKDVSILVSALESKIREREASRRLRIRRLPVILKLVLITGDKALANAPRNGGSV